MLGVVTNLGVVWARSWRAAYSRREGTGELAGWPTASGRFEGLGFGDTDQEQSCLASFVPGAFPTC